MQRITGNYEHSHSFYFREGQRRRQNSCAQYRRRRLYSKPYSLGVLLAKVKAVLKRFGQAVQTNYSDGYLTVNTQSKEVCVNGVPTKLTALEFRLLLYLIENKGKVISKRELFEKVWEDKFTGDGTLNVHIRRLREAIEQNPNEPKYIVTVWGDGYKFTGENQ